MQRFAGHVVVVTGGARGMGESHARAFVDEGARVVVADTRVLEGRSVADSLGDHALFVELDVTSEESWARAVDAIGAAFGVISVLINNAGIGPSGAASVDDDVARWRQVINVNLIGPFLGVRAVVPSMRERGGGAIVNIGSVNAMMGGLSGTSGYSASKWGLRGLTKVAAIELARDNIRVNTVHPGSVDTPIRSEAHRLPNDSSVNYPIARIGRPEEISRMVLFLASDEASYSTGGDFVCDGGMSAGAMDAYRA